MSGGVVCDPRTGAVLGMVTSGITVNEISLPITYALPSEVLRPFVDAITFDSTDGTRWSQQTGTSAPSCLPGLQRAHKGHGVYD